MNFDINENVKPIVGQLFYRKEEHSFDFQPGQSSDISIMIGYINIGFDSESMCAKEVWGYHPISNWINESLSPPKSNMGGLLLNEIIEPGLSVRIIEFEEMKTFYDKNSGWICIGDKSISVLDKPVEFAYDTIVVLKNFKIKSIWLKPLII